MLIHDLIHIAPGTLLIFVFCFVVIYFDSRQGVRYAAKWGACAALLATAIGFAIYCLIGDMPADPSEQYTGN